MRDKCLCGGTLIQGPSLFRSICNQCGYIKEGSMGAAVPGGAKTPTTSQPAGTYDGILRSGRATIKSPLDIPQGPPLTAPEVLQRQAQFQAALSAQVAHVQAQTPASELHGLLGAGGGGAGSAFSNPYNSFQGIERTPPTKKKAIQISPRQPRERRIILED